MSLNGGGPGSEDGALAEVGLMDGELGRPEPPPAPVSRVSLMRKRATLTFLGGWWGSVFAQGLSVASFM